MEKHQLIQGLNVFWFKSYGNSSSTKIPAVVLWKSKTGTRARIRFSDHRTGEVYERNVSVDFLEVRKS